MKANFIPSAEGAIHLAMKVTPITIHQSESFILGLGRTGWSIARMLKGMGAHVTGVARKPADLARAVEMGIKAVHFADLEEEVGRTDARTGFTRCSYYRFGIDPWG